MGNFPVKNLDGDDALLNEALIAFDGILPVIASDNPDANADLHSGCSPPYFMSYTACAAFTEVHPLVVFKPPVDQAFEELLSRMKYGRSCLAWLCGL